MTNMSIQPLWLTHLIEFYWFLNSNLENLLLVCFLIRPILDPKFPLMTCTDEKGEIVTVKGIPRKVSIRQISSLQMKNYVRKGCKVFVVHVMNDEHMNKEDKLKFDDIPFLK